MPDLTEAERQELHDFRNADTVRKLAEPLIERRLCRALGVEWSETGTHWTELALRVEADREMRADWKRRKETIGAVRKSLWEKIVDRTLNFLLGAGGLAVTLWFAKKFGINLQ